MLYAVPSAEAGRLIKFGALVRARHPRRGVVEIALSAVPGRPIGLPTGASVQQYMGQRYTRVQRPKEANGSGRFYDFKPIHPGDQALFLLSVTDCGGGLVRRRMCRVDAT